MFDSPEQRHRQFSQQARWTQSIREYLPEHSQLPSHSLCLEVGCGTGAILSEWKKLFPNSIGIDLNLSNLRFAKKHMATFFYCAAAQALPYPSNTFDCIFSHFFFLWVKNPFEVLCEIKRCLKPGGFLFLFAEPDYGGRIDFPIELSCIREFQIHSLTEQGADPLIGRKLQQYLLLTGYQNISGGILGNEWKSSDTQNTIDMENILWDMQDRIDPIELQALEENHKNAQLEGTRISYVPTFFYTAQK